MASDPTTGWGRPAKPWSRLAPRSRAAWATRGRPYGLTGRQAHRWASARPTTRQRYTAFGRRFGLGPLEVYREPELVRAQRRKPRPGDVPPNMIARPWRYTAAELWPRRDDLRRAAATEWGRLVLDRQEHHLVLAWAYLDPDVVFPTGSPWHHSGTVRDDRDLAEWVADVGPVTESVVVMYRAGASERDAFVWTVWFPDVTP